MMFEDLKNDIEKILTLEKSVSKILEEMRKEEIFSDSMGDLYDFKYDVTEKYRPWFIENFPRFHGKNPSQRLNGYYLITSYGTDKEKKILCEKEWNMRDSIREKYSDELDRLKNELSSVKLKYEKYFRTIFYDSVYDGASPMTDFLIVVSNFLEDIQ